MSSFSPSYRRLYVASFVFASSVVFARNEAIQIRFVFYLIAIRLCERTKQSRNVISFNRLCEPAKQPRVS